MDCAKVLLEHNFIDPGLIRGIVKNPAGILVWWLDSGDTCKENCIEAKLYILNAEELEHIEFTIDAFLKRRGT